MTKSSPDSEGLLQAFREGAQYGWIAKGLLYSGMGLLGLGLGLRSWSTGEEASQNGALKVIVEQPFGRVAVFIVAAGLALYAMWQLVQSINGFTDDGQDIRGTLENIGAAGLSVFYAFLSLGAFELAIRGRTAEGSGGGTFSPSGLARTVMEYPLGRWVVAIAGLVTIGVGVYHLWKTYEFRFLDDLDDDLSDEMEKFGQVFGTYGMLARTAVLATAGFLVVEAAWTFDPEKAGGFDQALREIATHPLGTYVLIVVAAGFIAAGAYDAVTFRHQKI